MGGYGTKPRAMRTIPSNPLIEEKPRFHRVFMQWVLVTDVSGNRRPQMYWRHK